MVAFAVSTFVALSAMVKVCRLQTVVADLQRASGTYAEDGTWDDRAFYRRTGPGADFVLFRTSVPFQLDVGCVAAGTWLLSDSALDRPAAIAEGDGIFPPIRGWQHAQSGASMLISVRPVRGSVAATVVAKAEQALPLEEDGVEQDSPLEEEEAEVEQALPLEEEAEVEQDSPLEEAEVEQALPLEEDGVEQDSPLEEAEVEVEQDSPFEEDDVEQVPLFSSEEAEEAELDSPLEEDDVEQVPLFSSEEVEVEQDSLGVGGANQEPVSSSYRRLNLDKAQPAGAAGAAGSAGAAGVDNVWQDFWTECRAWKASSWRDNDEVDQGAEEEAKRAAARLPASSWTAKRSWKASAWQERGSWKASSWRNNGSWKASSWKNNDEVDHDAEEEAERAAKRRRGGYDAFQDDAFWTECAAVGVGETLVWQGRGGWLNKARLLAETVHRRCVSEDPDISERCAALSRWMSFSITTGERASEVF